MEQSKQTRICKELWSKIYIQRITQERILNDHASSISEGLAVL